MAPEDAGGDWKLPLRNVTVDPTERRGRRPDRRRERVVACVEARTGDGHHLEPSVHRMLAAVVHRRIERCLRSGDRVCLLGGTRVVAWLDDDADQVQPVLLACRLVQAVGEHFAIGRESLQLRVVVGVGSALADVPARDLVASVLHHVSGEWLDRSGGKPSGCGGRSSVDPGSASATVVLSHVHRYVRPPFPVACRHPAGRLAAVACPVALAARRVRRHQVAARGVRLLDPSVVSDPEVLARRLERAVQLANEGGARRTGTGNGDPARLDPSADLAAVGGGFAGDCESLSRLTSTERRVLLEMMQGRSGAEIATVLTVSLTTVRAHIRAILRKLEVSSQLAAVATAYRVLDLVPQDAP